MHEKEIGSWFSLASPIKTTAGFLIKKRIGMKRKSFAHELHEFARKRNWQLVFSGFADKNNSRFFD
ncbi:hypothetical protein [Chlorobium phaeobacteroides]|uniref:hypothetical protein n=1 Tax=Chlorobium phaeobacteroides TaxID=1096 RepID=UPI00059D99C3|nr:hypothetical protein [Chlorobium phaeobacteroides]